MGFDEKKDGANGGTDDLKETKSISEQVEERKRKEAEGLAQKQDWKEKNKISSKFVRDCLYANELGDGILYSAMHQGQFIFNKSSEEWMFWTGHYWEKDILGLSLASVENIAVRYLDEAKLLVDQVAEKKSSGKKDDADRLKNMQSYIYGRVSSLRSDRRRNTCLKFAHTNLTNAMSVNGNEFDKNPWLLACKNGVIDLRTGRLRSGRQDDYISKACPVEWKDIDEPAPVWENALKEIFENNEELIDYIGRIFGYGITGLSKEPVLPVLCGQGRNGKTTIIETISSVLGPLARPIESEMLLDQGRYKSLGGPSPHIMALKGLRLAFASEIDEGRRISASRVKWLTGGDTLVGRNPHDRYEIEFDPSHTVICSTNYKPQAPADDFALWERVHLIPFNVSFVNRTPHAENERPADADLIEKLKAEAPGILAWLVRGCLRWQEHGLDPPPIVINATAEYRREEDLLQDFIEECLILEPYAEEGASELYTAFSVWWQENVSKKAPSQKKFGRWMSKRFKRQKRGKYIYFGIRLLSGN